MHPRPIAPAPPRPAQPSPLLNRPPPVAASESPSPPIASTSAPSSGKAKKQRRSKVAEACRFCRRSHMSCDAGRPCGRCVKRDIAHLCREEPLPSGSSNGDAGGVAAGPAPAVVSPSPGISASPAFQNPISNTPTKVAAGAEIDARGLGENTLGLEVIGSTSNGGENYSLNASNNAFDNGMYSNSLPTMALNSNFNLAMVRPIPHPSAALERGEDHVYQYRFFTVGSCERAGWNGSWARTRRSPDGQSQRRRERISWSGFIVSHLLSCSRVVLTAITSANSYNLSTTTPPSSRRCITAPFPLHRTLAPPPSRKQSSPPRISIRHNSRTSTLVHSLIRTNSTRGCWEINYEWERWMRGTERALGGGIRLVMGVV